MPGLHGTLLESLSALADPTRCRMLLVLEPQELTVSDLCVVLQLPQSTVSRHLKVLADAGLVTSRREGTSRYYSLAIDQAASLDEARDAPSASRGAGHGPKAQGGGASPASTPEPQASGPKPQAELWQLARRELADRPAVAQDARRLARVLAARAATSRQFFASAAGQWDQMRDELFGEQFYCRALLGLLPASWVVADLGCGTGAVAAALAPHVARLIGVDASDEMLAAAANRLGPAERTIDLRRGALEALPIEDASVDAATLVLVLHHLPAPAAVLAEARRVLKPGGRVLIVDMAPHEREAYRQRMGHVWLGFSEEHIRRLLDQAGFDDVKCHPLPVVTEAKGPALFAASAARRCDGF